MTDVHVCESQDLYEQLYRLSGPTEDRSDIRCAVKYIVQSYTLPEPMMCHEHGNW